MSNLPEQTAWESGIHQLEEAERAKAGPGGVLNTQATQLANRTRWLRALVESAQDYHEYTFYKSESDPDGTIAGLENTPAGKMFRVAQSLNDDLAFIYYLVDSGAAVPLTALPGRGAITRTIRQFSTLELAENDVAAGNISDGTITYVRSADSNALAVEYINNSGTLEATGRSMPSQEYIKELISSVLLELYNTNYEVFEALTDFKKLSSDNDSEAVLLIDKEGRKIIVADHSGKVLKAYGTEILSAGSLDTTLQPKFSDLRRFNDDSTEETVLCIDANGRKLLSLVHSSRSMMIYGKEVTAMSEDEIKEIVVSMLQPLFADQYQYDDTGVNETTIYVDSAGRKLLVLDHANKQLKAYGQPVGSGSPYLSPTKDFTIIGDSLSVGTVNGATAWRTTLAGLLPGRTFNLQAISGQNSSMITPRIGAQPPQITVDGNSIPASGSVNITACQILSSTGQMVDCQPLTSNGYQTMNGWLCGVYGAFARVSGAFTFTRAASGTAVYCAPGSPFERDFSGLNFNLMTVWVGRNDISGLTSANYSERVANLKDRLTRIYNYQLTQEKRVLFVTPPVGGPITPGVVATGEVTGTLPNNFSREISVWMKDKWGDLVLDCVPWSFQYASASADDISDVSLGIVPRSLRTADTPANDTNVHWGTALQTHLANWMYEQVIRRGW
ncbi:flagellar biosynthesis, cell-distal portion of basal-body rod [Klebsiella pneumoniae]|nr:flagellar biosynthesis, cell-distal portion of basal-body rod [Klebsiella pneumoniae]